MKFIVGEDAGDMLGIETVQETVRVRKAYIKMYIGLDKWYAGGSNHREEPGGWMLRDLPNHALTRDFETLDELAQYIGHGPIMIEYNETFELMELSQHHCDEGWSE